MTGVQTCALPICFPVTIRTPNNKWRIKIVKNFKIALNKESILNKKMNQITFANVDYVAGRSKGEVKVKINSGKKLKTRINTLKRMKFKIIPWSTPAYGKYSILYDKEKTEIEIPVYGSLSEFGTEIKYPKIYTTLSDYYRNISRDDFSLHTRTQVNFAISLMLDLTKQKPDDLVENEIAISENLSENIKKDFLFSHLQKKLRVKLRKHSK